MLFALTSENDQKFFFPVRPTSALQPRRFTIAPSGVGCKRLLGRLHDARVFFAAVNADSSISTRSLTIRSTHLSTRLSRWSLARNAARAASSAGIDKDVDFGRLTTMAFCQAESSSAWAVTNRST